MFSEFPIITPDTMVIVSALYGVMPVLVPVYQYDAYLLYVLSYCYTL